MSEQLSLLEPLPPVMREAARRGERIVIVEHGYPARAPRELGRQAGEAALDKAQTHRAFDAAGCKKFMLGWIRRHQRVSGEDLTTAAADHGFDPGERRAYGPVIASLVREGLIRCDGYVPRRFGHGCAGGRVWTVVR